MGVEASEASLTSMGAHSDRTSFPSVPLLLLFPPAHAMRASPQLAPHPASLQHAHHGPHPTRSSQHLITSPLSSPMQWGGGARSPLLSPSMAAVAVHPSARTPQPPHIPGCLKLFLSPGLTANGPAWEGGVVGWVARLSPSCRAPWRRLISLPRSSFLPARPPPPSAFVRLAVSVRFVSAEQETLPERTPRRRRRRRRDRASPFQIKTAFGDTQTQYCALDR